jgi:hypothetical protein
MPIDPGITSLLTWRKTSSSIARILTVFPSFMKLPEPHTSTSNRENKTAVEQKKKKVLTQRFFFLQTPKTSQLVVEEQQQ